MADGVRRSPPRAPRPAADPPSRARAPQPAPAPGARPRPSARSARPAEAPAPATRAPGPRGAGTSAAGRGADAPALPAPAVAAAVRILDYLAKDASRAGVSEIARALGIHKSTCYNVLLTLGHFGVVAKLPGAAQYQLGPRLAELGRALRRQYGHRDLLRAHLDDLVAETGQVGVVGQALGDDTSFVIIDRIEPPGARTPGPAPKVGAVFPLTGPAMGRALLACRDDDDALSVVGALLPALTDAQRARWRRELAAIRAAGYATSVGAYDPAVNAVAAPLEHGGEAYLVVALIGAPRALPARRIAALEPVLAARARAMGAALAPAGGGDA
jgi:DNA-binding IclR family transcriptional regulator